MNVSGDRGQSFLGGRERTFVYNITIGTSQMCFFARQEKVHKKWTIEAGVNAEIPKQIRSAFRIIESLSQLSDTFMVRKLRLLVSSTN